MKKALEAKNYSHLDTLLDDVIQLRHTPDTQEMHTFEKPYNIPKNTVTTQAGSHRCTHN